jgi:uncharacterized RDD family membrane protein YckC
MLSCRKKFTVLSADFSDETDETTEFEYVGFWLRAWAGMVDCLILTVLLVPLVLLLPGSVGLGAALHTAETSELLVSWIFPALLIFAVWTAKNRTPGKRAISAIVIDERTSAPPSTGQQCGRYLGYFLAIIPFGLGLLWVAFDPRKQEWHDKLAGTIVVRPRKQT